MSLFRKRKNLNIRQRLEDDEENAGELKIEDFSAAAQAARVAKEKNKAKKNETRPITHRQSVLSFGDELEADDGIAFQEKKSSLSYKLRKEMKKEKKEKVKEEKDKRKAPFDKQQDKNGRSTVSELDELGIRIVNGREAEAIAAQPGDSDESDGDGVPSSRHKFRPRGKGSMPESLDPLKKILQSGEIPDANTIHAIRKQRQQAREQVDFLPVDDTVRYEDAEKGRLIRDDENDRSDDEEGKLGFALDQMAVDRQQRREVFDAAQVNKDSDTSDQEGEWERQQLLKAGAKIVIDDLVSQDSNSGTYSFPQTIEMAHEQLFASEFLVPQSSSQLPRPVNYQAEGIIKRLQESRQSLEEVYRRHRSDADSLVDDTVTSQLLVSQCSKDEAPLKALFEFFQDLRGYVHDLRDCLNEKIPEISRLEEQVYTLYKQRSQKMLTRRRQDIKDQNDEFSPFALKGLPMDEARARRSADREGRRTRRRREREKRRKLGDHHEGTSTDEEEMQSEISRTDAEFENIVKEALKVFEDVEEEFSQVRKVMIRFESWRQRDTPSYVDAYVPYNLPKVFAPYIRLQMLLWNPLLRNADGQEIERMKWFNLLLLYGADEGVAEAEKLKADPDSRLMSHLVEKVVLVKLKEIVVCCYDPLSRSQTVRLVSFVRHYIETYPTIGNGSKPLKDLIRVIVEKIRDCIDNDVFIPMFPKNVYENRNAGVSLFFQRQFWSAWKLLSSALMWHMLLSETLLHDLAVRSVLNLYLLPALTLAADISITDAIDKCKAVINALPRPWVKQKEGGTHPALGRIENFLVKLADKMTLADFSSIKDVAELLRSIGAMDQAERVLSSKFGINSSTPKAF